MLNGTSIYAAKELQQMAMRAVRDDAKAAGLRAKFISWSLEVTNSGTVLLAFGQVRDRKPGEHARAFEIRIAL